MIPDGEKIIGKYLRDDTGLDALHTRVVGNTPSSIDASWIRVSLLDATDAGGRSEHLISYLVQIDCFASKAGVGGSQQAEASLIARTARAALHVMPDATHDGAIVTSVVIVGMARIPDTAFEPARERVSLTATIFMHAS